MKTCCEVMQEVLDTSDGPFYYPLYISVTRDRTIHADRLAVTVYRLTPSKNGIAKKGRKTIFLNYCPFCGERLEEDSDQD